MADNKDKKVLNVPALRFPEFTEEWNEYAIGKVLSIGNGRDYKHLHNGNIPVFGTGGYMTSVDDFLYDGESVFIGRKGTINKPLYYNGKFWTVDTLFYTHSFVNVLPKFVYCLFQTINWLKYNEASGVPSLSKATIEKIKVCIPSMDEQDKLSNLLFLLDKRIEVQNKIIEDLKKLKSAIVEMLFCIQGGVLLRLGDIGSFVRGLTYSNEDITEDVNATTVIRANNLNYGNNVNKEDVVYVNKKPAEIQILRKGDIVICMSNGSSSLVGKNSYYSFDDRHSTIGAFCGVYRTSQQLVKWLMQSQRYKRLVYQSLQGGNGAIANLNGDDILNMTFRVVEHEKNVSILSALGLTENSIAVNENLQELYSAQKVYLLRHLFI